MKTLKELSHNTFYKMEQYSQLVIDLVQEVEDLYTYDSAKDSFGALKYTIENVLEVIDKTRLKDVEALKSLAKILEDELNF